MHAYGGKFFPQGETARLSIMAFLLIIGASATYWCHHVLHVEVVFSHLLYLPITLAGIWWGRKGAIVAGFLGLLLVSSHALSPLTISLSHDSIRALIFIMVGFTVGWLSDLHTKAMAKLIELNITRNKFFSIISHDLRSPFQTLMHLSADLSEEADTLPKDRVREYAQRLSANSKRLFSLVEDLLEWSRIETGTIERQPTLLAMDEAVETVARLYDDFAAQKNIRLARQVPKGLTAWVDRNQLNCILRNLISNAIKFTRHGGEARVTASAGNGMITVSVADNGIGISPDMLEKIFRIDVYHTTAGTDNEKGSGLGLVLCKNLAELNGGSMTASSLPGRGSTFSFTLPAGMPKNGSSSA